VDERKPRVVLYRAVGNGGQRISVLPNSGAVIVYLSDVRTNQHVSDRDVTPLDSLFAEAFRI